MHSSLRAGDLPVTPSDELFREFHSVTETVTKSAICRMHGWSRYEFELRIREGMPYVAGAGHKGDQWRLDPAAVGEWLAERAAREAERRRLAAQRAAAQQAELQRQATARAAVEEQRRRAQREAEQRYVEEIRQRREAEERERALDDCYTAFFRLAMRAYHVTTGPGWPDRPENQHFFRDWPNKARGGVPAWWRPPPGALEFALAERRRERRVGELEPDYARFLGDYRFGDPWPWRQETTDAA